MSYPLQEWCAKAGLEKVQSSNKEIAPVRKRLILMSVTPMPQSLQFDAILSCNGLRIVQTLGAPLRAVADTLRIRLVLVYPMGIVNARVGLRASDRRPFVRLPASIYD